MPSGRDDDHQIAAASVYKRRLIKQRVDEAYRLGRRILDRLERATDADVDFVRYRFAHRLAWFGRRALWQNRYHAVVAVTVIAAGLISSGVTALADPGGLSPFEEGLVIALGVIVGVGTGLAQILRPAQKSVAYQRAYNDLLQAGWDFVNAQEPYNDQDVRVAFSKFAARVAEIENLATAAEELAEPAQQA